MSKKTDLGRVLELLINEEREEATKLLHNWFVEKSRQIHESLIQEDDELDDDRLQDLRDDMDEIESEEFFNEIDLTEDEEEDEEELTLADAAGDLEAEVAADDVEIDAEADEVADLDDADVEDRVEDLEAQLAELKAEFDKLMGAEEVDGVEVADEKVIGESDYDDDDNADYWEDVAGDVAGAASESDAEEGSFEDTADDGTDVVIYWKKLPEDFSGYMDPDAIEAEFGKSNVMHTGQTDTDDGCEVIYVVVEAGLGESFDALDESFDLETVSVDLDGSKEIGKEGSKITVGSKSPVPANKSKDRAGGSAVEVKDKPHKGFDLESAPKPEDAPVKGKIRNAKEDPKKVDVKK